MQPSGLASTAPYLAWHARHTPDAVAIVEDGRQVDYRRFAEDLVRCTRALEQRGVGPGLLVGIEVLRHRYLHLLLLLACEVAGATTVSVTQQDVAGNDPVVRDCEILLMGRASERAGEARWQIVSGDWLAGVATMTVRPRDLDVLLREVAPDRSVRIFRTSGTTGRPKAMAVSRAIQQRIVERHMDRVAPDTIPRTRSLCLYNLAVRAVHVRVLGVLQRGGTVLFAKEEHAAPLFGAGLVNHAMFTVGDAERIVLQAVPPPPGHRMHVELVGASVGKALRRLIEERLGARISTRYSSNETNVIAATDEDNIGTLCPGVAVRIVDAAGHDRPPGETGLIRVRTDTMVDGYLHDPAATAAAFIDGWYHTNDEGYMPEPGRLVVLGRADDMLNIGGVKLAPAPLEAMIRQIPDVSDAALISVNGTSEVTALLVAVELATDRIPADLAARLRAILTPYVRHFVIVPLRWFPRTETGKVRRPEIRDGFLRHREQRDAP
ncbi:MAG: fatty acid--CoA ligase family protein [Acetobacteraceae bacterium]|nr:fatty acid--CoA ligase family protein [Acetobacteraceae bacterium]